MSAKHIAGILLAGALGCNSASGPRSSSPVNFRLAAAATAAPTAATAGVEISSSRLVVGTAALGSGDQFGCVDCPGNGGETASAPQLVSVPTDGSPVQVATEQVTAGVYNSVEIELHAPDPSVLAAAPGWPAGATVEIAGKFNGTDFTLPLSLAGSFRETLGSPVTVTDGATPSTINITITLPVSSWFVSNGVALNPTDPSQRAQIEQNARLSLSSVEAGEGTTSGEK